ASQRWIAATGLSIFFALAATAAEPRDESHRWVPSTSLFFDALGQKLDGAVKTGQVLGPPLSLGGCLGSLPNGTTTTSTPGLCPTARGSDRSTPGAPLPPPTQILGPDVDGSDTSVAPLVGASLELMTPSLLDAWLRPRLFLHGDGAYAFSFER